MGCSVTLSWSSFVFWYLLKWRWGNFMASRRNGSNKKKKRKTREEEEEARTTGVSHMKQLPKKTQRTKTQTTCIRLRTSQFTRGHDLNDGGFAVLLRGAGLAQRVPDLVDGVDGDPFGTHAARDFGKTGVFQIHTDVAISEPKDLVLLFRAPLAVVEHHRRRRDRFAHAGQDFVQRHACNGRKEHKKGEKTFFH